MEENQGYVIRQSVLFDNGRGFALGEHPREGFVTWQFTQEGGHRDYYWGHYYDDGAAAEKDYADRAARLLQVSAATRKTVTGNGNLRLAVAVFAAEATR